MQTLKDTNFYETEAKAEQRRKDQKERSDLLSSMGLPFAKPPNTYEEKVAEYNRQKTFIGKQAGAVLERLARQMSQIARYPITAGVLMPMKDGRTGKTTDFITY